MREAVLDTRVDQGGRALVLFRGAPLQGCSGLEMSAAVNAIAAWAAVNNGVVRMRTTLPDGSTSEDLIHGDGTVVPAVRAAPGRRAAAPVPVELPPLQPSLIAAAPADHPQFQPSRPAPAPVVQAIPPVAVAPTATMPVRPEAEAVHPSFPADPFTRMNQAEMDPPRQPHRFVEAVDVVAGDPAPHTQASWRMPLEEDEETFDVEALAGERPPPSSPLHRGLLRVGVIILLALVAALLGVMFLLPAPDAAAAVPELTLDRVSSVSQAPSGIGDALPENRLLTFALAGGLAVAAGGAAGLLLTKALRKPRPVNADDLDDELLLSELDISPLPRDEELPPDAGTDTDETEQSPAPAPLA